MSDFEAKHPRGQGGKFSNKDFADPGQLNLEDELAQERELRRIAYQAAGVTASRWHGRLDVDDLASQTTIELLEQRARDAESTDGTKVVNSVKSWSEFEGRAMQMANALAVHAMLGRRSGPDIAGYREYSRRIEEYIAKHKRMPGAEECSQIADEVRSSFPAGRRPVAGFHRIFANRELVNNPTTLHGVGNDGEEYDRRGMPAAPSAEDTAFVSDADEVIPSRLAYTSLADIHGAPSPVERGTDAEVVAGIHQVIENSGGYDQVASDVRHHRDSDGAKAFLSVFGELSHDDRTDLGDVLVRYPGGSEPLIRSALEYAQADPVPHRLAYAALADAHQAPVPRERSATPQTLNAVNRLIKLNGGHMKVAQDIRDHRDSDGTRAFLSLFGKLSTDERTKLGTVLSRYPSKSQDLMLSAMQFANKEGKRERGHRAAA